MYSLSLIAFFFYGYGDHRDLHSFPTRRSSDLGDGRYLTDLDPQALSSGNVAAALQFTNYGNFFQGSFKDRKSTRLNSSHMSISYAVFCLKKKKKNKINNHTSIYILSSLLHLPR